MVSELLLYQIAIMRAEWEGNNSTLSIPNLLPIKAAGSGKNMQYSRPFNEVWLRKLGYFKVFHLYVVMSSSSWTTQTTKNLIMKKWAMAYTMTLHCHYDFNNV